MESGDNGAHRIRASGACFLPPELFVAIYELGARPSISKANPKLFYTVLARGPDSPAHENVLDWVQASFIKMAW